MAVDRLLLWIPLSTPGAALPQTAGKCSWVSYRPVLLKGFGFKILFSGFFKPFSFPGRFPASVRGWSGGPFDNGGFPRDLLRRVLWRSRSAAVIADRGLPVQQEDFSPACASYMGPFCDPRPSSISMHVTPSKVAHCLTLLEFVGLTSF